MARLRGATTVLVGIQPDVAFSVIRLGMDLDVHTAFDLEQGLSHLEPVTTSHRAGDSALNALRATTRRPSHLPATPTWRALGYRCRRRSRFAKESSCP